ncbi:laccase domain-containing protein [Clostridium senegalense]
MKKENINTIKLCTYCCKKYKLYSYRKIDEREGRLFSFVYMK